MVTLAKEDVHQAQRTPDSYVTFFLSYVFMMQFDYSGK